MTELSINLPAGILAHGDEFERSHLISINRQSRITIYEDNQGAVYISGNPVDHNRTKHIDVRYHYVREKVADGAILVQYIPTEKQVADYFTKALPEEKFKDFVSEFFRPSAFSPPLPTKDYGITQATSEWGYCNVQINHS